MTQSLFQKAQGLIELLAQDPLRAHVMTYLSRELGSTSEATAVAFLQLSRDGTLHVVSHEGFEHFDPGKISHLAIDSDRAASETLRGGRLRIFTNDQLRTQRSELPSNLSEMWSSTVAIPIGLQSLYFLNFREDVTSIPEFESFIQLIASLLTSFELQLREKSDGKTDLWYDEKKRLLSSREELVLTLIREGKTNAQIAFELGYSESLIRQETVSIYRKLGVNGRKDLKSTDSVRKPGIRPLAHTAIALSGIELLGPIINTLSDVTVLGG
jgi:DNA-binding CsgD family transcriptional regulator